ncbi:hypothetical protein V3C99_000898 [Haemonchus contortus]|uniref:OppC_N domain-containing protein n=1 Tax=Haemonchus contortus TaxID=6289 RepID=A0A7I4YDN1_HAECO|nr:Protein F44E2.9 [Haemonchus contortus]
MRPLSRLLSSWKFLPNRERIVFKSQKAAFREFWKVVGVNLVVCIGFAAFIVEFAFPTPDMVYDWRRKISPDFDLYCRFGEKAEFDLDISHKVSYFKYREKKDKHEHDMQKSPVARFGGTV